MILDMFDKTVYECTLLSITPQSRVKIDASKRENIKNASLQPVKKIMVQKQQVVTT